MSKYSPFTNTKLLKVGGVTKSFATMTRQQRKYNRLQRIAANMARKFAGMGRGGNPQWTEGMCPRRRRRAIIRAAAKAEVERWA